MNRRTLYHTLATVGLATVAARDSARATEDDGTPPAAANGESICGQTFRLRVGETAITTSGFSIRFTAIDDERCPLDWDCEVAGFATIQLDLAGPESEQGGYPETESFKVDPSAEFGARRYNSFVLILDYLAPSPWPRIDITLDEYEIGLIVIDKPVGP